MTDEPISINTPSDHGRSRASVQYTLSGHVSIRPVDISSVNHPLPTREKMTLRDGPLSSPKAGEVLAAIRPVRDLRGYAVTALGVQKREVPRLFHCQCRRQPPRPARSETQHRDMKLTITAFDILAVLLMAGPVYSTTLPVEFQVSAVALSLQGSPTN